MSHHPDKTSCSLASPGGSRPLEDESILFRELQRRDGVSEH